MELNEPCAYGGDHPAEKYMSGTPICWRHWNWVKLDLPAANHWAKVAKEFLSNVDMYDVLNFMPAAGLADHDFARVLEGAQKILAYSLEVQQGPPSRREGPICAACGDDTCLAANAHHQVVGA